MMNWTFKLAYDEMDAMMNNRPWLLVDDQVASAEDNLHAPADDVLPHRHTEFMSMQKEIMLQRGWDWFKRTIRGRFFPKANVTTITTFEGENTPQVGDPDLGVIQRVQNEFPGASIVSLIGQPHVISGPPVSPDILQGISRKGSRWNEFIKTASVKVAETDLSTPYYKDEFEIEIADVDRYATDKYRADLAIQETDNLYSIGFQMYNYQVGMTGAVLYWHYDKDEFVRAKRTFKKLKTALSKVMADIEYHRPPMAVITPMVRAALQSIDVGKKERSGNYFYNWFEMLPKESDWRETLYGNRYPSSSIQPIDAFLNIDEEGKAIVSEGTSRSRVLRYKPFTPEHRKYAADMSGLQRLLSVNSEDGKFNWKIPAAMGGGTLAWLLSLGIPPAQLEQQLQQGATPQQIMTQVAPQNIQEVPYSAENELPPSFNADFAENTLNSTNLAPEGVDNRSEKSTISRGIRNNNPGNITRSDTAWQGMSEEQTDERFITFESPEYGIRAMARVLKNYGERHNLRTIEQIISRWAPPSENQTDAYIHHISQELGIPPTTPLDLSDDEILKNLLQIIIKHENGTSPYDEETIKRGIELEKAGAFQHAFPKQAGARSLWHHAYGV